MFKRIKNIRNYLPSVDLSLRFWFWRQLLTDFFLKYVFLKILQYWSFFLLKLQTFFNRTPTVHASGISWQIPQENACFDVFF